MLIITLIVFIYCLELLFSFFFFLLFICLLGLEFYCLFCYFVILHDLCTCCFVLILVKFLTVNIGTEKCDFMWSIPISTYDLVLIV